MFHTRLDLWWGCGQKYILRSEVRDLLDDKNIHFLSQVDDRTTTNLWCQGWRNWKQLHLLEELVIHWDRYTGELINAHIITSDDVDELIWDNVDSEGYTPKFGYLWLNTIFLACEPCWWWKHIWRYHCPVKSKLLAW